MTQTPSMRDATASPPSPTGEATPASGVGRRLAPLRSWRRHRALAAALFTGVLALGAPLAWWKGRASYGTEAAVRVSPTFAKVLQDDEELRLPSYTQYRQFVQQQVRTIQRYETVVAGLDRMGPQRALWQEDGESDRHAAERLMAAMTVKPVPDTYLVTVGLEGHDPSGLAEVVNAVVEAYLAAQLDDEFFGIGERVKQLEGERTQLAVAIDQQAGELARLAGELGVTSFNETGTNPYDQVLAAQEDLLARERQKRVEADARLAALDQAQLREGTLDVDAAADAAAAQDPSLSATRLVLMKWRGEVLEQLSGLTADHPGRPALERQLREIDSELTTARDQAAAGARARISGERKTAAARERSRAQAEADQARESEQRLAEQVNGLRDRVAAYTASYQQALNLRAAIARDRKQLNRIADRIQFLTIEQRSPGFVRMVSPARTPDAPVKGGRRNLLALVGIVALLLAAAAPIALDRFDPRVIAPNDLSKVLGFPPLGWTAEAAGDGNEVAADQLRRLALALERERRVHGSQRFVFSGVTAESGVSRSVLDAGRELGQLGLRVLAIDCNPRSPDPRYRGSAPAGGLAAVVDGSLQPVEAVVPAGAALPARVPLGAAAGGTPLAPLHAFRAALDTWSEAYDILLLDAPPLLRDADAELIVQSADAAVLVVAAGRILPDAVRRAARILERISPPVVGALLTRVCLDDGRVDVPPPASAATTAPDGLLGLLWSRT